MNATPGFPPNLEAGPDVELTPLDVFARLLDPAFYEALPPGSELTPEVGLAAYVRAVNWAAASCPLASNCPALGDMIDDAMVALSDTIRLAQIAPQELAPLRQYLAAALGFSPSRIKLYYQDRGGAPQVVMF